MRIKGPVEEIVLILAVGRGEDKPLTDRITDLYAQVEKCLHCLHAPHGACAVHHREYMAIKRLSQGRSE